MRADSTGPSFAGQTDTPKFEGSPNEAASPVGGNHAVDRVRGPPSPATRRLSPGAALPGPGPVGRSGVVPQVLGSAVFAGTTSQSDQARSVTGTSPRLTGSQQAPPN